LSELIRLIQNEMIKIVRKKRFLVIFLILTILIPIFVYAQMRQTETLQERMGDADWQTVFQQQIVDSQNRLSSSQIPEEWKKVLRINIEQNQFYLDHNINPTNPGGPTFAKEFLENSISLFLPLLIMIVATDLISGEHGEGTIKLLLTRPVKRWKILLSKLLSLLLFVSLIVAALIIIAYIISGTIFGYSGWDAPILTGFNIVNDQLDTSHVQLIPLWQFIMMSGGFAWFVGIIIGIISLMVSVLVRSSVAGMGIMLASLISGTVLTAMASSWEGSKYLYVTNLELIKYLTGDLPPVTGMTLPFSLMILSVWGIVALIVAFVTFNRQDMLA